jgi:hypothetical protein
VPVLLLQSLTEVGGGYGQEDRTHLDEGGGFVGVSVGWADVVVVVVVIPRSSDDDVPERREAVPHQPRAERSPFLLFPPAAVVAVVVVVVVVVRDIRKERTMITAIVPVSSSSS